ncbi:TetR/AcrR family transcriptional regulator [Beijerinckia indica]|uniref:Transcriptional regulator, TetR family n=1 Tax=Beijerinckia indica subsp. indica (strain ATCC 9039 / DSM 1715 / NCIMB 8712) TaxID=395963 RepID=B2IHS4_BEII9|nr:TetR/AcrR family transcriptional regulator [Beijerinckia indica]ACB95967.1 transcriptional regulator, TetR family [Beijerinckia indica subsp. indica ATCC 9039]
MPRPRQHSDDEVLDKALDLFWSRGFAATSMRDLSSACSLSIAALYNRFHDKDGLFVAVLRHYADQGLAIRLARLAHCRPPEHAIALFFDELIDLSLGDEARRGCLLVNTALDGAALPETARVLVRERLGQIEAFFADKLYEARAEGTLSEAIEPATMAEMLLGTVLAIRVLARLDPDPFKLRRLARAALASLDPSRQWRLQ